MKFITLPIIIINFLFFIASQGNHIGFNIFILLFPLSLNLLASIILKNKKGIIFSVLCIIAIFAMDKLDFIIEYDAWIKRGMPEPFSW